MKILISLLLGALFLLHAETSKTPASGSYVNTLTVNGLPLDSDSLSFRSEGVLAIVEGDLRWSRRKAMPYQSLVSSDSTQSHQHMNPQAEIWPSAWVRDQVIDLTPSNHKPVLFRVSLRRGGSVLKKWPVRGSQGVYALPLAEIWVTAQLGDELVVEPMIGSAPQPVEVRGKRVLKLEKLNRPIQRGC
jgi:hypothetical protein